MSLSINDSLQNNSPKPVDNKYGIFASGSFRPYASVAEANATVPPAYRSIGLTVVVNTGSGNVEYWYQAGVADGNLVAKGTQSTVVSPITLSGSSISIQQSNASQNGYLSSSDWSVFNTKVGALANIGTGTALYTSTVAGIASVKSLKNGTNITFVDSGSDITISSPTFSGVNLGSGSGIFSSNSGANLQFRGIVAGSGVTVTQNSTDVTISVPGTASPSTIVTSNATPTALTSVTIEDNSAGQLEVSVIGIVVGAPSSSTAAKRYIQYYKQSGVLAILGSIGDLIPESTSTFTTTSWDIVLNSGTNSFDIMVTGQASTTIKWAGKITKFFNS